MRPDDEPRRSNPLELSRLDLISCALGGAVFLGLIFSVVRQAPPVLTSAPPFIESRWVVRGNPNALLNLRIQPPGHAAFDLPLEELDLESGRPKQGKAQFLETLGAFRLLGFSRHGDGAAFLDQPQQVPARVFKLLIHLPAPGPWKLDARYQNRTDLDTKAELEAPRAPILVERTIVTRDRPSQQKTWRLTPGELTLTDEIKIPPYPGAKVHGGG